MLIHGGQAEAGATTPVVLIHGSGPGASAWSNWRPVIGPLASERLVVAPDLFGFGATPPPPTDLNVDLWCAQVLGVIDALDLPFVDLVGNSYGGAIALRLARSRPGRIRRIALTGALSLRHEITPGLQATWSYEPSRDQMRQVLKLFAYDPSLVTDELVDQRYLATLRPGTAAAFRSAFHEPLQAVLDAACLAQEQVREIRQPTLIIHGREDRIVPVATSLALGKTLGHARVHIVERCGHWTAVEHTAELLAVLQEFLNDGS